ncbi:hypothetical protein M409DRAFT_52244 [Zasmidium cellare ATCC 36951]|uniref:Uncharacterized protein n=1 Tax=Zasmidium cellare ATCC 36951 TaxID=1080233 RepID=A0A6A6CR14_ZASCE|nr:uncharacterized protein M409DRAFT_52244 [Zasmidium cellare ATCC 36951]KAF2169737.1 hypothetical protein M409DRAFT_52244 [Zasmidium cellare ATCC 36951]
MPRTYNSGLGTALSATHLIPEVALSAVEILTYFPLHLAWPAITVRLLQAGFRGPDMAKAQLHARGRLTRAEFERRKAALRHGILTAGKSFFADTNFTQTGYANDPRLQAIVQAAYPHGDCIAHYNGAEITTTIDERNLAPNLQQVANGVINHPTGNDAGVLTQVIQWAAAAGQLANYTTDDVPMLAEQLAGTWVNEPAAVHGPNWDTTGLATVQAIQNPQGRLGVD